MKASDKTRALLGSRGILRKGGIRLLTGATLWLGHGVFVLAFGALILLAQLGYQISAALFFVFLAAVLAAVLGAILFALALASLWRGSVDLVAASPEPAGRYPWNIGLTASVRRRAILAAVLWSLYASIGLLAIIFDLILAPNFSPLDASYLLLDLWLLAAITMAAATLVGDAFLAKFLSLVGIYVEAFPFLAAFAGLTAFSSIVLIGSLIFLSGGVLASIVVFPFVVSPLVGIVAFFRIYQLAFRMSQIRS